FDGWIETFDVANHQGHAGSARCIDNVAALFYRRGDRLFHHDVDASRNAKERDVAMQMSGRRNGDRVDIAVQQFFDIADGDAAQGARHKFSLLAVWIGDANQFCARQSREHAGMIAAHNADADNPHTQRTLRACYCGLHHLSTVSPRPITFCPLIPSHGNVRLATTSREPIRTRFDSMRYKWTIRIGRRLRRKTTQQRAKLALTAASPRQQRPPEKISRLQAKVRPPSWWRAPEVFSARRAVP